MVNFDKIVFRIYMVFITATYIGGAVILGNLIDSGWAFPNGDLLATEPSGIIGFLWVASPLWVPFICVGRVIIIL